MTLETLVILALAAWRMAHLLVEERGILAVGERIRALAGVRQVNQIHTTPDNRQYETTECQGGTEIGKMLCCVYCSSFWTAGGALALWIIGTGLHLSFAEAIVNWFAVATLCIVAEKINRYV